LLVKDDGVEAAEGVKSPKKPHKAQKSLEKLGKATSPGRLSLFGGKCRASLMEADCRRDEHGRCSLRGCVEEG
jgi:hypothetical protein